jgi:hypothetical protein
VVRKTSPSEGVGVSRLGEESTAYKNEGAA